MLNDGEIIDYALGIGIGEQNGLRRISHGGGDAGFGRGWATMALGRTAEDLGYDALWIPDHLMLGYSELAEPGVAHWDTRRGGGEDSVVCRVGD